MAQDWNAASPAQGSQVVSPHFRSMQEALEAIVGVNLAAGVDIWPSGDAADPAHWLSGSATIARETTTGRLGEAMGITITGSGGTGWVRQSLQETLHQGLKAFYCAFSAVVWAQNTSSAYLWIDDGVASISYSLPHAGDGVARRMSVTKLLSSTGTPRLRCGLNTNVGNIATISQVCVSLGVVPTTYFRPYDIVQGSKDFDVPGTQVVADGKWYGSFGRPTLIERVLLTIVTAPTGAALIGDVDHWNGAAWNAMFSTRPQIAISGLAGGANPDSTYRYRCLHALDGTSVSDRRIRGNVDQIGSTVAGADLTFQVWGKQYRRLLDQFNAPTEHGAS